MTKYCSQCGSDLKKNIKICPKCGYKNKYRTSKKGLSLFFVLSLLVLLIVIVGYIYRDKFDDLKSTVTRKYYELIDSDYHSKLAFKTSFESFIIDSNYYSISLGYQDWGFGNPGSDPKNPRGILTKERAAKVKELEENNCLSKINFDMFCNKVRDEIYEYNTKLDYHREGLFDDDKIYVEPKDCLDCQNEIENLYKAIASISDESLANNLSLLVKDLKEYNEFNSQLVIAYLNNEAVRGHRDWAMFDEYTSTYETLSAQEIPFKNNINEKISVINGLTGFELSKL